MKAQHIRPRVQNGPVSRQVSRQRTLARPVARSTGKSAAKRARTTAKMMGRGSRRQGSSAATRAHDSRVFWLMVLVGALLTAGFVLGLRSQINAHQLNRAEEKLRDQLDRYASQQKFLTLEQERALSPRESQRSVKEAGLVQVKLDEKYNLQQLQSRPAVFGPASLSNALAIPAASKSEGRAAWGTPSDDKPIATRPGKSLKPLGKKGLKFISGSGKQSNPGSQARSKSTEQATGNKQKSVKTAKSLIVQKPKAKRNQSGPRKVARATERH